MLRLSSIFGKIDMLAGHSIIVEIMQISFIESRQAGRLSKRCLLCAERAVMMQLALIGSSALTLPCIKTYESQLDSEDKYEFPSNERAFANTSELRRRQ